MKHPAKKILGLYYYRDLAAGQIEQISCHLKNCLSCQNYYNQLSNSLSKLPKEQLKLSDLELSQLIRKVRPDSAPGFSFNDIKERASEFVRGIYSRVFYQPQLALVAACLIAIALIIPLGKQRAVFQEQVFEIQMDLVLGQDDFETFIDLYELDQHSQNPSSITISS